MPTHTNAHNTCIGGPYRKQIFLFKKNDGELKLNFFCHSYAIGGLAGGEDKDSFWRVVAQCTASLPEDKPRYVMV